MSFLDKLMDPSSDLPDEIDVGVIETAAGLNGPVQITGTDFTKAEMEAALAARPILRAHPQYALALMHQSTLKVTNKEQLALILDNIASRLQREAKVATDLGWDAKEYMQDEGEALLEQIADEREEAAEQQADAEAERSAEEANAAVENWMSERGQHLHPEITNAVAQVAIKVARERPDLSFADAISLAEKQVEEVARFASDASGIFGTAQAAAQGIPGLEDVEFLEGPADLIRGDGAPTDPFAQVSDEELAAITEMAGMGDHGPEAEPVSISEAGGVDIDEDAAKDFVRKIMTGDMTADANDIVVKSEPEFEDNDVGHGREVGLSTSFEDV